MLFACSPRWNCQMEIKPLSSVRSGLPFPKWACKVFMDLWFAGMRSQRRTPSPARTYTLIRAPFSLLNTRWSCLNREVSFYGFMLHRQLFTYCCATEGLGSVSLRMHQSIKICKCKCKCKKNLKRVHR